MFSILERKSNIILADNKIYLEILEIVLKNISNGLRIMNINHQKQIFTHDTRLIANKSLLIIHEKTL